MFCCGWFGVYISVLRMAPCRVVVIYCVGLIVLLQAERISGLRCYSCLFGCNGKFNHESKHVNVEENCQSCTKIIYKGDIYRFCSQGADLAGCTNTGQGTSCSCYTNLCNDAAGNHEHALTISLLVGITGLLWNILRSA